LFGKSASCPYRTANQRGSGVYSNGKEFHMKTKAKSSSGSKQSSSAGSKQSESQGSRSGTQGGTHEQHVEAGRQSHKNDNKRSRSSR